MERKEKERKGKKIHLQIQVYYFKTSPGVYQNLKESCFCFFPPQRDELSLPCCESKFVQVKHDK
jgi:hypothetical protein